MAIGDTLNPTRRRFQANERLDIVDIDPISQVARTHQDALSRAVLAATRAAGAAVPTGLIFAGGSLTANPTGAGDGQVRVNTELFVGLDADGRLVIKEAGTTLTASLPLGVQQQLYLYWRETATNAAVRRGVSASLPFVESSGTQAVDFVAGAGLYMRAGDATTILASDVVEGQTRALIFIGLAGNGISGDPNGTVRTDVTATSNRLATLRPEWASVPPTLPTNNYTAGSLKTEHDLILGTLWLLAKHAWSGASSLHLAPSAANNFGAYTLPAGGNASIDTAYRGAEGVVTIGDGSTSYGTLDRTDYANDALLLNAAMALLPASGGTIVLKPGVQLTLQTNNVVVPASKDVTIRAASQLTAAPHITVVAGGTSKITFTDTGRTLTLRDLVITASNVFISPKDNTTINMDRCVVTGGTTSNGALIKGAGIGDVHSLHVTDCLFTLAVAADDATAATIYDGIADKLVNSLVSGTIVTHSGGKGRSAFTYQPGANVKFVDSDFYASAAYTGAITPAFLRVHDSGLPDAGGKVIAHCSFHGGTNGSNKSYNGIDIAAPDHAILGCSFYGLSAAVNINYRNFVECDRLVVSGCRFIGDNSLNTQNTIITSPSGSAGGDNLSLVDCSFSGSSFTLNGITSRLHVQHCKFEDSNFSLDGVNGGLLSCRITDNVFNISPTLAGSGVDIVTAPYLNCSGSGQINDLVYARNTLTGYGNQAGAGSHIRAGLWLSATSANGLSITDNQFLDINNLTYTGTSSCDVVGININTVDDLVFTGNIFRKIAVSNQSGTRVQNTRMLHLENRTGVDPAGAQGDWTNIFIENNVFGDKGATNSLCLHFAGYFNIKSAVIANNRFHSYGEASIPGNQAVYISLYCNAGVGNHGTVKITGNSFHIFNNTGADWTVDSIDVSKYASTGATLHLLEITNNTFVLSAQQWQAAGKVGIRVHALAASSVAFTLLYNNAATRLDDTVSAPTKTFNMTVASVSNALTNILPANPGVGSDWTHNIGIISGY